MNTFKVSTGKQRQGSRQTDRYTRTYVRTYIQKMVEVQTLYQSCHSKIHLLKPSELSRSSVAQSTSNTLVPSPAPSRTWRDIPPNPNTQRADIDRMLMFKASMGSSIRPSLREMKTRIQNKRANVPVSCVMPERLITLDAGL